MEGTDEDVMKKGKSQNERKKLEKGKVRRKDRKENKLDGRKVWQNVGMRNGEDVMRK